MKIDYNKTFRGNVFTKYTRQINNSKKRGHPPPNYTREEFLNFCLNSENSKTFIKIG